MLAILIERQRVNSLSPGEAYMHKDIGSNNDLSPFGTKPLADPMLTY